jgi:hypothetical protein
MEIYFYFQFYLTNKIYFQIRLIMAMKYALCQVRLKRLYCYNHLYSIYAHQPERNGNTVTMNHIL